MNIQRAISSVLVIRGQTHSEDGGPLGQQILIGGDKLPWERVFLITVHSPSSVTEALARWYLIAHGISKGQGNFCLRVSQRFLSITMLGIRPLLDPTFLILSITVPTPLCAQDGGGGCSYWLCGVSLFMSWFQVSRPQPTSLHNWVASP